jgi:flavin reductase (DIM6/NTAB) family NADH-FMN oxidoreductase RutF
LTSARPRRAKMATTDIIQRDLSDRVLRDAYGHFATGVAIVTTCTAGGERIGATISSFNAVSLQPPLIMFSISHQSKAFPVWRTAKHFAVNILAQDQSALSSKFARALADKWNDVRHSKGQHDIPLLAGCLACFECERHAHDAGGDHLIIIGRVDAVHCSARDDVGPLIFFRSKYEQIAGPRRDEGANEVVECLQGW